MRKSDEQKDRFHVLMDRKYLKRCKLPNDCKLELVMAFCQAYNDANLEACVDCMKALAKIAGHSSIPAFRETIDAFPGMVVDSIMRVQHEEYHWAVLNFVYNIVRTESPPLLKPLMMNGLVNTLMASAAGKPPDVIDAILSCLVDIIIEEPEECRPLLTSSTLNFLRALMQDQETDESVKNDVPLLLGALTCCVSSTKHIDILILTIRAALSDQSIAFLFPSLLKVVDLLMVDAQTCEHIMLKAEFYINTAEMLVSSDPNAAKEAGRLVHIYFSYCRQPPPSLPIQQLMALTACDDEEMTLSGAHAIAKMTERSIIAPFIEMDLMGLLKHKIETGSFTVKASVSEILHNIIRYGDTDSICHCIECNIVECLVEMLQLDDSAIFKKVIGILAKLLTQTVVDAAHRDLCREQFYSSGAYDILESLTDSTDRGTAMLADRFISAYMQQRESE